MALFEQIHKAVLTCYRDEQPLWMTSPEESVFRVLSKREFEQKSDQEVQDLFRKQHIVVQDQSELKMKFDEGGLQTLGDLFRPVTIQGS